MATPTLLTTTQISIDSSLDTSSPRAVSNSVITTAINAKQDTLVSGTSIKTINNQSLLGSGNITISGGGSYQAGTGINITNNTISVVAPTSSTLGGVKAGNNITIDSDGTINATGGGGGVSALSDLSDVSLSSPAAGQALVYNGSTWANNTVSGSGGTVYDSATYSLKSVGSLHTDLGNFSTDLVSYYDGTYYGPKGEHSTTIGGSYNIVTGYSSTALGGVNNTVTGAYSTALGGSANTVSGDYSTTVGGTFNYVSGNDAIHTGVQSRGSVNNTISCNDRSAYPAYFSNYNMYGLCGIKGIAVPWNYMPYLEKNLWNIDPNGAYVFRIDVIIDVDQTYSGGAHNYLIARYDITINNNTIEAIYVTPPNGSLDTSCFSIIDGKLKFEKDVSGFGQIDRADMQFGIFYTMYTNIAEGGSSSSSSSGG